MQLRGYQRECLEAIRRDFAAGRSSTLVVMATGLGKTVCFATLAAEWETGRVLILAHREELIFQACKKAEALSGSAPDIEMGEFRADHTGLFTDSKVVVASVQTLCQPGRLQRFDPSDFGLLIVDEAHHCVPKNKTYARIVERFKENPDLRFLGVTATPDRADKRAMGSYFESVAYEYGILEGIDAGFLVPIEQEFIVVEDLDFSSCRTTAGDLNEGDLAKILTEEKILHRVVSPTIEKAAGEPTLIFTVNVDHAHRVSDIINRHHQQNGTGKAIALDGKTDKELRRQKLREYEAGEFQFLVGCGLFLEGFDCPRVSVIAMARPTKSRALYTQAIGRGTRILPGVVDHLDDPAARVAAIAASAKKRVLVLDFVGNSGKHKLISTADLLAGKYERAVIEGAIGKAKKAGRAVDMRQAMDELDAEQQAEKQRLEDDKRKREEANRKLSEDHERRRRERVTALARYQARRIDPFGRGDATPDRSAGFGRSDRLPTQGQRDFLQKQGLDATGMSWEEAQAQCEGILGRYKQGLCSMKQASVLRRGGENPDVPREVASMLIDLLKARRWKSRDYEFRRDHWSIRQLADGTFAAVVNDPVAGKVVIGKKQASIEACRELIVQCMQGSSQGVAA